MEASTAVGSLAKEMVSRSIESMNGVIKEATDASQNLADRMIRVNAEQKVQNLQDEGIGQALNLLA